MRAGAHISILRPASAPRRHAWSISDIAARSLTVLLTLAITSVVLGGVMSGAAFLVAVVASHIEIVVR